jgi:uncharacterized membrane protein YdjX (TVP38/TMEM64 family)
MKPGRLVLPALLLAMVAVAWPFREQLDPETLRQFFVQQDVVLAGMMFVAAYALATLLFVPGSLMTLLGGLLFGPVWGSLLNLTGATIGATLAFLAARYLAAGWVERKARGRLARLKAGVESEGWRFVAFVRLVPLFPFNLLNYALGLTRIRLADYILASALCMLPGAVAYTWLGYLGGEAASGAEDLVRKLMMGIGLLALSFFLPRWVQGLRAAREAERLSRSG